MRWSVTAVADGDRELSREEIVELADAVAGLNGVASGIGTTSYGARFLVDASTRQDAILLARKEFAAAAHRAGLPDWPIGAVRALAEDEDDGDDLNEEDL